MTKKSKLPTGWMIKCEAVELTSSGRLKRIKLRESELKKLKRANPKKRKPAKKTAKRKAGKRR